MKVSNFLCFFCVFFFQVIAAHAEFIKGEVISQSVNDFLFEKISQQLPPDDIPGVKLSIRQIDNRLKLKQCDKPLTHELQNKSIQRNVTVRVSCNSNTPWSIYISASLSLYKPVLSVSRELPRLHIIDESDLVVINQNVYNLRAGYNIQKNDVVGKQLKRAVRSGEVVYSYQLKAPDIIKKGDLVTVVAKRGSLSVISPGIALSDASAGEKVRVENQRSSKIIHVRVTGPGTVEVL